MAARIFRYLRQLKDVASSSPAEKDLVSYNASTGKYTNRTIAASGLYSATYLDGQFSEIADAFDTVDATITGLSSIYAPIASPTFTGDVHLNNLYIADDNDVVLGTTNGTIIGTTTLQKLAFFGSTPVVKQTGNVLTALSTLGLVASPTLTEANVTGLVSDLALKAPLASPTFTGIPAGPTASTVTNSTQLATTAFVQARIDEVINGAPGALDTLLEISNQLATDESAVAALIATVALKAPLASPTFTGTVILPATTYTDATNISFGTTTGTKIGTATSQKIAFYNATPIVQPSGNALTALNNLGLIATPTLAASDISSGSLVVARGGTGLSGITSGKLIYASATDTFAALTLGTNLSITTGTLNAAGSVSSVGLAMPAEFSVSGSPVTGSGGFTGSWVNQTTNLVFASPNGSTGTPAFRALVAADIPAIAESGVTNLVTDLGAKAPLASPTFTGTPAAPTAANTVNTTQLATTAFVQTRQATRIQSLGTTSGSLAHDAALYDETRVTANGNVTLTNPTNPTDGQGIVYRIKQDGTGSRTISLDTAFRLPTGYTLPTGLAASKAIYLACEYCSADSKWDVFEHQGEY